MKDLLQEYQALHYKINRKIKKLNFELKNESLQTMEYEQLKARRDLLRLEEWEIMDAINEMRKHL